MFKWAPITQTRNTRGCALLAAHRSKTLITRVGVFVLSAKRISAGHVVVQYRALQGPWKEKKLSGNDKLSGLGDTRVNNCTVVIFNYLILFS